MDSEEQCENQKDGENMNEMSNQLYLYIDEEPVIKIEKNDWETSYEDTLVQQLQTNEVPTTFQLDGSELASYSHKEWGCITDISEISSIDFSKTLKTENLSPDTCSAEIQDFQLKSESEVTQVHISPLRQVISLPSHLPCVKKENLETKTEIPAEILSSEAHLTSSTKSSATSEFPVCSFVSTNRWITLPLNEIKPPNKVNSGRNVYATIHKKKAQSARSKLKLPAVPARRRKLPKPLILKQIIKLLVQLQRNNSKLTKEISSLCDNKMT